MRRATLIAAFILPAALCSCGRSPAPRSEGKLGVFVSIPPQAYFVGRIGGEHVEVGVMVRPGQDPHTFEPTPRQMAGLSRARAYFSIGLPFETRILGKVASMNKDLTVFDTTAGIALRPEEGGEDEHGHHDGEMDPHTWLDPKLAKIEAANICAGLKALDPANAAAYDENLRAVESDLNALDAKIAAALAPLKGKPFMVYHAAFGYFADAYGLVQVPVALEGKEPTARQLAALIEQAKQEHVRVIFVQPQFPKGTAQSVADEIGGVVVPMDPLAQDYVANLEDVADKIQRALATGKAN
jgi:zinc transport system substrate-binding protein